MSRMVREDPAQSKVQPGALATLVGAVECEVRAAHRGQVADGRLRVLVGRDEVVGACSPGGWLLVAVAVHRDDRGGAGEPRSLQHRQADTTEADDQHRRSGGDLRGLEDRPDPGGDGTAQ